MIVKELKKIIQLLSMGGVIDEFIINTEGHIVGVDPSKTAVAILDYPIKIDRMLYLTNITGITELLNQLKEESYIEILDSSLHIVSGTRVADIILELQTKPQFKLEEISDDAFEIIVKNIPHTTLNELGQVRPKTLINEVYHFFTLNNKLMMRIGEDITTKVADEIGINTASGNGTMRFEDNVAQCFKSIMTTATIKILLNQLMVVESGEKDEACKYTIKYYLAPKVE